jgi:hypothetical protein
MARYAGDPALRQHLADKLRAIGHDAGATEVEGLPSLDADGAGVPSWDPVVFAALLTPEELREAEAKGLDIRTTRVDNEDENFPMYRPPGV